MVDSQSRVAAACIVGSFLLSSALGSPAVHANEVDGEDDAKKAIEAMHDALEAGDIGALDSTIASDWSLFMTMRQWQGVADKSWLNDFANMNKAGTHVRFDPISQHFGVGDKVAWYRADEAVSWVDDHGAVKMRAHWLTTQVYERREGKWVVVHIHHSFVDDPPEDDEGTDEKTESGP